MGKGIKACRKKGKSSRPVTEFELRLAQKRYDALIAESKTEATMNASKIVQAIVFLSCKRLYGFGEAELQPLVEKVNDICDEMADGALSWESVYKELEEINVFMEE